MHLRTALRPVPAVAVVASLAFATSAAAAERTTPSAQDDATPVLSAATEAPAVSQSTFIVIVTGTPAVPLTPGDPVTASWKDPASGQDRSASAVVGEDGAARFPVQAWKGLRLSVTASAVSGARR